MLNMIETVLLEFLCFCSSLSFLVGGICFIFFRDRARRIMTVAPGLQTFLKPMSLLWFFMPLSLTVSNLYILFEFDFTSPVSHFLRSFMVFSSNIIDFSALTISIDCAVASLTRTQDPLLRTKTHGYIASVVCIAITLCIALAYQFDRPRFSDALSYFSMISHISCFVIEVTLLIANSRRHKVIPFAYQLSVRHKLVRNIKLLRLLVPFLFITTIFSTFGPNAVLYLVRSRVISTSTGVQLIFSTEVALLIINIRRHKIVPFTYELSIRHKLVRNIKLLQLLCPFLLVATVFSAIGPVASLYLVRANAVSAAVGTQIVYVCYNAAFLSIIVIFTWKCRKQTVTAKIAFIKSNDQCAISHFQQLKTIWG
uniref:G protein-coupled receptor n=1 Tax=Panagrellus redivivus TaxID=6233 RepID=A0A7E4VPC5_PANRE